MPTYIALRSASARRYHACRFRDTRRRARAFYLFFAFFYAFLFALADAFCNPTHAQTDWPQWMGPQRDGQLTGPGWIESLPPEGLQMLWRADIGGGYAGPAVYQGRVVVTDFQRTGGEPFNVPSKRSTLEGKERISCFDSASGRLLWRRQYDCPYDISYPAGPRCTPTFDDQRVYTLGAQGDLLCMRVEDGSVVWELNFKKFGAPVPLWGHSAHPLIDGPRLICMVGGAQQSVIAFDKMTGEPIWKYKSVGDIGYCPPKLITSGQTRQLLIFHPKGVESLNPETGKPYWQVPMRPQYGMSVTMPQFDGEHLYVSSIGSESVMLKLASDRPAVEELWRGEPKMSVYCCNSTPLLIDGTIYGNDCQLGDLSAVDQSNGKRLWSTWQASSGGERRASHATVFLTRLRDKFYLFAETGDFIIARIDKTKYEELGRARVIEPTAECFGRTVVWSHPAYAQRHLFVRNDKQIVCISLDADEYK